MPSSYSSSARYTLQATGENNNTWGAILNSGVFQLVDDNVNGRLAFALSTTKVLTTVLGATDEARMSFLDITGGAGGAVVIPPVPKGYFIRNGAAGNVSISNGGPTPATFGPGDAGPVAADAGGAVYPIMLAGKTLKLFITDANQAVIDYVNAAISGASISLPPATAPDVNKALMIRPVGAGFAWLPSQILVSDVAGLQAALDAQADDLMGRILLF